MKSLPKIIALWLGLFSFLCQAQELSLPSNNQYLTDSEFLIAPTYAGIGDYVRLRASGVSQWVGIKNAPDYQSLSADGRIADRSGAGITLYNDRNGHTYQKGGKLTYSHHLVMDSYENHFISLGLSYILNSFSIDVHKFQKGEEDLGVKGNRSHINHNFEAGVLYRYKGAFASLAVSNILNKSENIFSTYEPTNLRNYNLFAGYRYKAHQRSSLELEPSIFVQFYEADRRSSSDINFKIRWFDMEDYYWGGVSYRFLNDQIFSPLNFTTMFGIKKDIFYFAYGYQLSTNKLIGYNSGSHLITIGVDLFQGLGGCQCLRR